MMIDWGAMLPERAECAEAATEGAGAPAGYPTRPGDGDNERGGARPRPPAARRHDDMRYCAECANLAESGRCLAALRREFVASRNYEPIRDILLRCGSFLPLPDDPDQRAGRDRWPGL